MDLVYCEQLGRVAESEYAYTSDEMRWDAWQRLRDIEITAESHPSPIGYGQFVYMWLHGIDKLDNIDFEVMISDGQGNEFSKTKSYGTWLEGEKALVIVDQTKENYWKAKRASVKITDKKYDVSSSFEFTFD
jgi:hypothetical protein